VYTETNLKPEIKIPFKTLLLLALLTLASVTASSQVVSASFSGLIGGPPYPPGFPQPPTTDTLGLFGPAGANLVGKSISVSYAYNTADFSGPGSSCGTNCMYYTATNQLGNSVSVTVNGVTKTITSATTTETQVTFQNSFPGYSANWFAETMIGIDGTTLGLTFYTSNSVAFGQPIAGITPNQGVTFLTGCTLTCSEEDLVYVVGETQLLHITTTGLPNAVSGQPYSATLSGSGGVAPYKWGGSVPAGFTLGESAGVLSSTGSPPTPAGSYSFLVYLYDAANNVATQQLTLTVAAPAASLSVSPTALNFNIQPGAPAQAQSLQISGVAGADWQATATTLTGGAWLSISPAAGQIPGSLTAFANPGSLTAGTYQGSIAIQAPGATPSSSTVNVTLAVTAASGQGAIITTVAGNGTQTFSGDGGPATSASLIPFGVTVDASGNLFIADTGNNRIRKVSASGVITTVAGSGPFAYGGGSFSGDGGPAIAASLNNPSGVAVDVSGNLFIADTGNNRIRKVSASGIITTVAGDGSFCILNSPGDGGPATAASVCPSGVAVDAFGNIFIADTTNNRIRKVPASGIITTVAGGGSSSFSGDGGLATSASLSAPTGVAVDASGNLFIADSDNNRIRKVSAGGIITTVAGSGSVDVFSGSSGSFSHSGGFAGDGGTATSALLSTPMGVAVDASGNFFIADSDNNRIRKVSAGGIITTVAGSGNFGLVNTGLGFTSTGSFSGDGGPATSATLANPFGVAVNASGNLFIADDFNYRIREVQTVNAVAAIQNAASYATGAVSPGEIVVLYGAGLGPSALATSQVDSGTGLLQTTVAGTTVLFNDTPAALLYTSANQVSAIVPYEITGSATAEILVNYQGQNVAAVGAVTVAPSAPGIFTVNSGTGQAAALNQDGSVNSVTNAAAAGSTIVLYLTGEGQTAPPGVDGKIATAAPYPAPVLPVTVTIGGQPATYAYAGAAPGEVAGVMQINASIPMGVAGSTVPVSVQIGTVSTQNGVTIAVQ
jgi:uncharacterized protein (TIGR03437 family)